LKFEGTVQELLLYLHINPETVLVSRNDELLTESDVVSTVDIVKILSVVSGG
jgi:sulfur carrier protein ThiS